MKETFRKNIANYITIIRIVCVFILLALPVFSNAFFILYFIAGVSDVLDGFLARKLKIQSEFGARLDSFADISLLAVCLIKTMPYLLSTVRPILWVALGIILVIKVISIAGIIAKTGSFGLLHTFFAKFNGVLLFLALFLIPVSDINILGTVLIIFCGIGAIEEVIYVACFDKLNLDTKGLVFEIIKK